MCKSAGAQANDCHFKAPSSGMHEASPPYPVPFSGGLPVKQHCDWEIYLLHTASSGKFGAKWVQLQ
jgi:hypothetical protein